MNISRRFTIDDLSADRPACPPSSHDEAANRPRRVELAPQLRDRTSMGELTVASAEIPVVAAACCPGISMVGPTSHWLPDRSHQGVRLGDGLAGHAGP